MQSCSKKFSLNLSNPKISNKPIDFTWSPTDSPLIMYSGKMVRLVLFTIQQKRELYIALAKESLVSIHSEIPLRGVLTVSSGDLGLLTISSSRPAGSVMPRRKQISASFSQLRIEQGVPLSSKFESSYFSSPRRSTQAIVLNIDSISWSENPRSTKTF